MGFDSIINSSVYTWLILPLLIFSARIVDVSLGTIRLILISRGIKNVAALVSFFEILIWTLAISQIFRNLNNVACYLAYAGGFASGSYLGITIVEKLSLGKVVIQIITAKDATDLVRFLRLKNFGVTCVDAQGSEGLVKIIFSIIERYNLRHVVNIVKKFNPRAFYSIEEVKFVSEGIFPQKVPFFKLDYLEMFRPHRKSK